MSRYIHSPPACFLLVFYEHSCLHMTKCDNKELVIFIYLTEYMHCIVSKITITLKKGSHLLFFHCLHGMVSLENN